MKIIQSSILRAVVAIAVGVLLIKYREGTMTWMTIAVGVLFFMSGLISCIVYYFEKERAAKASGKVDEAGNTIKVSQPMFPIVGVGSGVLGVILAFMPEGFIKWVAYILAAILILGAINQFMNLANARHFARVPVLFWSFPIITLCVGIYIIANPMEAASLPLKIIGWCLMFYGVVEIINSIKIFQMKRAYDKIEAAKVVTGTPVAANEEIEEAVVIEEEK